MRTMTRFKRALVIVLAVLMTLSMVVPAFAANSGECASAYSALSSDAKNKVDVTFSGDDAIITVDGTQIDGYKSQTYATSQGESTTSVSIKGSTVFLTADAIDDLHSALTSLGKQAQSDQNKKTAAGAKAKVNEMVSQFNPEANVDAAAKSLGGFKDSIGVLLGIAAYIVMAGLSLFTACDLLYITIPFCRNGMDSVGQSGGGSGVASTTSKSTGETKFRWITDEAMYAVKTATIESGQSAIWIYVKKRVIAIIAVAIAIYILLTGNIGLIMNVAMNLVSGIIDMLTTLGG